MRRIWAIADTHLSFAEPKPMDVFGAHWKDHAARIERNCRTVMAESDILLIPGDLSWAMKRAEAEPDLNYLASLPGTKVLCKGNHDYWWDSDRPLNYPGLNDTPFISEDGRIGVAGTRGWIEPSLQMSDAERAQCAKIAGREFRRLEKRLQAIAACPIKFALIHYPPIPAFAPLLKLYGVDTVLYGHVHLSGKDAPLPEQWNGLRTLCVACDRINFTPRLVKTLHE
jgi:predicted phosphohydrolase